MSPRTPLAALVSVVLALALAGPAAAAPERGSLEERPVVSASPDAGVVRESFVRVYDPLPPEVGPHPEACDYVSYLRFRHAKGPAKAADADAVGVFMPGYLGGASYFDQVARGTVTKAADAGRFVEFWALDRRSNCLEDQRGIQAASRAKDASIAFDYYFGGKAVDGRRFGGFKSGRDVEFLRSFGMERAVRDWRTVLLTGIPDRRDREAKVICGGHSLGGRITGAFSSWDFDGDPTTTDDAGFRECAGFAGFDTRFTFTSSAGATPSVSPTAALDTVGDAQNSPNENTTPLTPETFQLPAIIGVGAFHAPTRTDVLRRVPSTPNIEAALKLFFSRNAAGAAAGPSIRDFEVTNAAALGGIFDDNSAPLSFLRASVGFFTGGAIRDKNFPSQGDGTFAIPTDTAVPVGWQDYDAVGAGGAPLTLNEAGKPYTERESEVSSLRELARTQIEAPANFIEQYFPRKLSQDADALATSRSGSLANVRYDGPAQRPAILIQAGESRENSPAADGPPVVGDPPNTLPLSRRVTLPGYNHNDTITAAARQNDGRPEPSSAELAAFMLRVAGQPTIRVLRGPERLRARQTTRVRVVLASVAGCRRGVRVRLAGRRARTDGSGRATLRVRLAKPSGTVQLIATKAGCRPSRVAVEVLPARRAPGVQGSRKRK